MAWAAADRPAPSNAGECRRYTHHTRYKAQLQLCTESSRGNDPTEVAQAGLRRHSQQPLTARVQDTARQAGGQYFLAAGHGQRAQEGDHNQGEAHGVRCTACRAASSLGGPQVNGWDVGGGASATSRACHFTFLTNLGLMPWAQTTMPLSLRNATRNRAVPVRSEETWGVESPPAPLTECGAGVPNTQQAGVPQQQQSKCKRPKRPCVCPRPHCSPGM
jgi:hypothetical protein